MSKQEIFEELLEKYKRYNSDLIMEKVRCFGEMKRQLGNLEREVENYKERFKNAES